MEAHSSVTDLVALYDELVLSGDAPPPEEFSAAYPQHPQLLSRLRQLARLRGDLDQLFAPPPRQHEAALPCIPGFRVVRPVGQGGMGSVYLAEQLHPKRLCALKLMDGAVPAALDRFRREANLAARLDHPGVATVYAAGVSDGQAYLAAEMVHGFSLRALLQAADLVSPENPNDWFIDAVRRVSEGVDGSAAPSTKAPVAAMMRLATEIADALAHAHGRGVIHRDVKPSNVIVTLDCHAKLIDFGIAVTSEEDGDRLTRTGMFIGSHGYAAPEQLRGEHDEVGPWTDTYALGATLFEMLTQRTPFEAATYADRLGRAAEPPPFGPRHYNRKVPRALDALVMRALHPDPEARFHDGEELAEALRACPTLPSMLPGIPTKHLRRLVPRTVLQGVAAGATASALLLGYLYGQERVENERMAARHQMAEMMAGNALLDAAVRGIKGDLESCLSFEQRVDGNAARPARLVVDLLVKRGVLADVQVSTATTNVGARARRCMLDEVRHLELPGIGFAEPVMLQIDLRVAPPPGG